MALECELAEITLRRPDDWHHHLRDGDVLVDTVRAASRQFARAIIMPNLVPPVTTAVMAAEYKSRIAAAMAANGTPAGSFIPLMTMYLTDSTTPDEIRAAAAAGDVKAVKLYPAGATTNSDSGVTDYAKVQAALVTMAELGMTLCVHGEVTDPAVDIFDRERVFVRTKLPELLALAPGLKIVLEHLSTREAVEAVLAEGSSIAGTLTPQHLLVSARRGEGSCRGDWRRRWCACEGVCNMARGLRSGGFAAPLRAGREPRAASGRQPPVLPPQVNRNAMLSGGIRPHLYCLPILKTEDDRQALLAALRSGCPRLFLGTDSAPHAIGATPRHVRDNRNPPPACPHSPSETSPAAFPLNKPLVEMSCMRLRPLPPLPACSPPFHAHPPPSCQSPPNISPSHP